jgi:hypothetical protein
MIVELCGTDLLDLVNGKQVAVGDIIVRPTEKDASTIVGEPSTARTANGRDVERHERRDGNRRSRAPRKTGAHVINARFDADCDEPGCPAVWNKGDRMVYDYDRRKAYCPRHGVEHYPELRVEVEKL